jgi:hypothetical protein
MNLRLAPSLQGSLARRAAGRVVVIDAYRSWNCGTWVGDVTARWADAPPGAGFVAADAVEDVPVFVDQRLAGLLAQAGPSLHGGGPLRRGRLRVELDRPQLWISWLDHPGAWGAAAAEPPATEPPAPA